MQVARDRQKSYADLKRKPMEFEVGDKVMLKVSPWKGVVRFGKRGKLNPRFVGHFKVIKRVGDVAYELELPEELSRVHNTFHLSNLKKCHEPIEIIDREVKWLKRSRIPLVKVRWNSKRGPEFTWEREDQFRKKYPHLFSKTGPSKPVSVVGGVLIVTSHVVNVGVRCWEGVSGDVGVSPCLVSLDSRCGVFDPDALSLPPSVSKLSILGGNSRGDEVSCKFTNLVQSAPVTTLAFRVKKNVVANYYLCCAAKTGWIVPLVCCVDPDYGSVIGYASGLTMISDIAFGLVNKLTSRMDDPNITMEEYIRLEEERAQNRGKVYNWETATYGKIWYDEDVYDLRSVETEFSAIVFNDSLTFEETLSCEPMVSSLNDEIDFRTSFDDSDEEDYMPKVSYFDDLYYFKDFENEFPAIVYNDALTSKSDFLTDEFNLKDETSLFECDEEEQNILHFNNLFPFNVIYLDDSKLDKDNDDDKIDIKQSLRGTVINDVDGAYAHGLNKLLETSHDTSNKIFKTKTFVKELNVNIMTNYLN
ncbi:hypothetical protein Tco_0521101 [Tanacetum coccineum]